MSVLEDGERKGEIPFHNTEDLLCCAEALVDLCEREEDRSCSSRLAADALLQATEGSPRTDQRVPA